MPTGSQKTIAEASQRHWTFLSNHSHVLVVIARESDIRVRDIARAVGITERAVHRILTELDHAGVIERERTGRRTHYRINRDYRLRHPLESERSVDELLEWLVGRPGKRRR